MLTSLTHLALCAVLPASPATPPPRTPESHVSLFSLESRYRTLLDSQPSDHPWRDGGVEYRPPSSEEQLLREGWLRELFGCEAWQPQDAAPLSLADTLCRMNGITLDELRALAPPTCPRERCLDERGVLRPGEVSHLWLRAVLGEEPQGQVDGPWGSLKTQLQAEAAPRDLDVPGGERWLTEESLQMPVAGPLYLFGQFRAGYNTWTAQELSMSTRTGVGCKLRPLARAEVILSGASVTSYAEDPLRPDRVPREKAQMVLELQANYSLLGPVKLEYQGAATPALDPLERNRLSQDVRFAIPLGEAGHIRLGARHNWEAQPTPRPWTEGMQLYLGVGIKR